MPTTARPGRTPLRAAEQARRWQEREAGAAYGQMVCDGEVRIVAPASVVAFVRCAIRAHARPGEPRWRAFERLLAAAIAEWERQPRHRDPIFARDGWRCAVPACSARGPFHDHHLRYRSRGGGNEQSNRLAACVAHHLHGIHQGWITGWGTAPGAVHWHLGTRPDAPPLLELVGDCYVSDVANGVAEARQSVAA